MNKTTEEYYEYINENKNRNSKMVLKKLSLQKKELSSIQIIEMLEKEDIDAVSICTESGYHGKHAIDCLNAGKHVLVEKPMALSSADADEMIRLAKKKIKLGVCHQNRFNPQFKIGEEL